MMGFLATGRQWSGSSQWERFLQRGDFPAGFVEVFACGWMKSKIVETSCSCYGGFEFGPGC